MKTLLFLNLLVLPKIFCTDGTEHGYKLADADIKRAGNLSLQNNQVDLDHDLIPSPSKPSCENGVIDVDEVLPWPNAFVYFFIPKGDFSDEERAAFTLAMCEIEKVSCVRFKKIRRLPHNNRSYVYFKRGPFAVCTSQVGMVGGRQDLILEPMLKPGENRSACFTGYGNVMHELCHAIGSYHEQNRKDRNNYVIVEKSALDNDPNNYGIVLQPNQIYGSGKDPGYDIDSIVHFPEIPGKIMAKNRADGPRMGQRVALSPKDIKKLQSWNKCGEKSVRPLSKRCRKINL